MATLHAPNRNYVWTYTFVQALAEAGLRHVVIAPGSRSTPLTMAFAQHPSIRAYSHIDERGAAFMALGISLAEDAPAAVVCSSGTAAANFYPAIVEAHYARVPLLVLTADRPHELRDSGANQTVDQVKLYGDHVLWSVDVALPEADPPIVAIRNLRALATRAYTRADGLPKGPVHLNFPFRKPLEPTAVEGEGREITWGVPASPNAESNGAPRVQPPRMEHGGMLPTAAQVERIAAMLRDARRPLIVCGPRTQGGGFIEALASLGDDIPILADPLAQLRSGPVGSLPVCVHYDHYLANGGLDAPDVIVHFGAMPVSQTLLDFLNRAERARRVWIASDGVWSDADHQTDLFVWADPSALCHEVGAALRRLGSSRADITWVGRWHALDSQVSAFLEGCDSQFEGLLARDVVRSLPEGASLFVASSLSVRYLGQYSGRTQRAVSVYCNRGASGIYGTLSSALGVAAAQPNVPTVLLVGDLAFYHDMNALLALKRNAITNLVIVLLNNDGGQIFRRLPINQPQFEPAFTDLFLTPHGMTFEHTAAQFGLTYARTDDRAGFRTAFTAALSGGTPTLIEIVTDAERDELRRKGLADRIAEVVMKAPASATTG